MVRGVGISFTPLRRQFVHRKRAAITANTSSSLPLIFTRKWAGSNKLAWLQ
jgi:hypothetical protein